MRVPAPDPALATLRARILRRSQTAAETALWQKLRSRGLFGLRVKRQVPFGPWIIDFAVPAAQIAIEVDGESHATLEGHTRDHRRDAYLQEHGWRVMRFTNSEVLTNIEGVLSTIASAVGRHPHPDPLPQAGEGA